MDMVVSVLSLMQLNMNCYPFCGLILLHLMFFNLCQANDNCTKSIIEVVGVHEYFSQSDPSWILSEGSEFYSYNPKPNLINSWVTRRYDQWSEEPYIIIDLGCVKIINGYYIRNFHMGKKFQDGTKEGCQGNKKQAN